MIKIKVNTNKLKGSDKMDEIIYSSLSRVKQGAVAHWAREIGNIINLPIGVIKSRIEADYQGYQLILSVTSEKGVKLGEFKPRQEKAGTSVHIKKTVGRQMIPHAFVWNGQVWTRKSRKRLPIEMLYSTDVEDVAKDTQEKIQKYVRERFESELEKNIKFFLG